MGEGIAICEEQLRAVKWSDYRKLTRGLAAILFSPTELATCSVTGQRWSRAGTATERPVKPALDKAKVQAIICEYHFIGQIILFMLVRKLPDESTYVPCVYNGTLCGTRPKQCPLNSKLPCFLARQ